MNNDFKHTFISNTKDLGDKEREKYQIDHIINLSDKIKADDKDISKMLYSINDLFLDETVDSKIFKKLYDQLRKTVDERYGFKQKDSIRNHYAGLGLLFGVSLGVSLTSIITSSLAIFLSLGLCLGSVIGMKKEKEAEEKDLLY
ncbi:hypothetical protein EZV73_24830 [Acidaminobacter sp. JC074]|uniref:hypothetical protein n=1 Tax=Acidaminobacter sp. JC074 TaxID=2530199 RepID=UPI001F0D03E5|nr:hypothetical protein [Acidaminobacter sp. JC074]MCH4890828.1 hypothetical protein [Acidaminobacter sp. JC074]